MSKKLHLQDLTVVIPWRETESRRPVMEVIRRHWQSIGVADKIMLAECPNGPWSKSLAINNAIRTITTRKVIIADADCYIPRIERAIAALTERSLPFIIPHNVVFRLDKRTTARILNGSLPLTSIHVPPGRSLLEVNPCPGRPGGGVIVAQTKFMKVVPFDNNFIGWGGEDEAWYLAAKTAMGTAVCAGLPLIHLWHQKQPRATRAFGSDRNRLVFDKYVEAYGDWPKMNALLRRMGGIGRDDKPPGVKMVR